MRMIAHLCAVLYLGVLTGCQAVGLASALPRATPPQPPQQTPTVVQASLPAPMSTPQLQMSVQDLQALKVLTPDTDPRNSIQDLSIGLVEATSKTLLASGQIDFPLSIDVDLPVKIQRLSLDDALNLDMDGPRHIIVFEVAMAKVSRRVLSLKPVASTVFLGYAGTPYAIAADDPVSGSAFAQALNPQTNKAQAYIGASQPLGAPLIFDYDFDKAQVQARRLMSVNAYMIDRTAQTYVKSSFDISDQRRFEVAYRISRYDPKRKQHAQNFDTEKEVDEFEKDGLAVKLSSLLRDYAAKQNEARPFANAVALRTLMLQDRNVILADVNANTFDSRPLNDPRFDSVVAVYTGKGSLGSGFYVTPDVILTNWHVVEDRPFVEMKTYDGQETFGTVLGKDARLDVALVRVQNRGRPVAFYTGRTIDLGQSVEAIGHPHRHEFSITRGIISAVRKHHSINLPKGAGDDVLYIQTDAPINPGNSGGPLFLGERVVGMNTWGKNKMIAEGLNFSVHYSQLLNFMNEHLPGFSVSPAQARK